MLEIINKIKTVQYVDKCYLLKDNNMICVSIKIENKSINLYILNKDNNYKITDAGLLFNLKNKYLIKYEFANKSKEYLIREKNKEIGLNLEGENGYFLMSEETNIVYNIKKYIEFIKYFFNVFVTLEEFKKDLLKCVCKVVI